MKTIPEIATARCAHAVFSVFLALASALLFTPPCMAGTTPNAQPEIFCEFSSNRAPIDRDSVRIEVDGRDVTKDAVVQPWRVSYTPAAPLSPGRHFVRVTVRDLEGAQGIKQWEFAVDPDADETQPAALSFAPPTPANGALLISGHGIVIAAKTETPGAAPPRNPNLKLFRNGVPASAPEPGSWSYHGDGISAHLPDLPPGRYAAVLSAPGAKREISTAFVVAPDPPRIASFSVEPSRISASGGLTAVLFIEDASGAGADSCVLSFSRNGRSVSAKTIRAAAGANRLMMQASNIEPSPAGNYQASIQCTDAAGRATNLAGPIPFSIEAAPSQLTALDAPASRSGSALLMDRLPAQIAVSRIDITGKAPPNSSLALFVNGARTIERTVDSLGAFRFAGVPLDPGDNTIFVAVEDSAGLSYLESNRAQVAYVELETAVAHLSEPDMPPAVEPEPGPATVINPVTPEPVIPGPVPVPETPDELEFDDQPDPEPVLVELAVHVPPGAANGNNVPVRVSAPPGASVSLYVNGVLTATASSNNGGQAHFRDLDFDSGNNELYASAIIDGTEIRSPAVTLHVEPHSRGNP